MSAVCLLDGSWVPTWTHFGSVLGRFGRPILGAKLAPRRPQMRAGPRKMRAKKASKCDSVLEHVSDPILDRFWAGFWRVLGSILEPPGYILKASGVDFGGPRLDFETLLWNKNLRPRKREKHFITSISLATALLCLSLLSCEVLIGLGRFS